MTHIIIENFRFQLIHIFLIHNPSSCKPIKPDQARINQIRLKIVRWAFLEKN